MRSWREVTLRMVILIRGAGQLLGSDSWIRCLRDAEKVVHRELSIARHPHAHPHGIQKWGVCSTFVLIPSEMMNEDAKFALGF